MADITVGIVMGSDSDWPLVQKACQTLDTCREADGKLPVMMQLKLTDSPAIDRVCDIAERVLV